MIITIIGARPQFVKASVVSKAFLDIGIKEMIIHTGQHYDEKMSAIFWEELGIPKPKVNLNVGSKNHGAQTAEMMSGIENFILSKYSDIKGVLLYGDTNSTLAGALVAAKLNIPVIHIESGLRSFNKKMPEEINRIMTDHVSSFLFCPSETAVKNLKDEGITENVYDVGDVMYDSFLTFKSIAQKKLSLNNILKYGEGSYNLLTLHRPSNTDNINLLRNIFEELGEIDLPIVYPVHPRMEGKLKQIDLPENIIKYPPFSFLEMLVVLDGCYKVFTDSGGLQKEAFWAKKPCITLREQTEWTETQVDNQNILVGNNTDNIIPAYNKEVPINEHQLYGTGNSSAVIANIIKKNLL